MYGEFSKTQKKKKKKELKGLEEKIELEGRFSVIEKSILIGLLSAYGFHAIFVFDNLVSYMAFFAILAYIYHRVEHGFVLEGGSGSEASPRYRDLTKKIGVPAMLILTILTVWSVNIGGIKRANYLVYAINPVSDDFSVNFELFEKSLNQNTNIGFQEVVERMVEFSSRLPNKDKVSEEMKQKFFQKSESLLEKQLARVPNDARQWTFLGTLYNNFGKTKKGLEAFKRAHELSPEKQTLKMQIGLVYISMADFEKGLKWLKEAYEVTPEFKDANMNYAVGAVYAGEDKLAKELLLKGFGTTTVDDKKLLQAYVATNQFDKAISIVKKQIKKDPKNVQKIIALSVAYLKNGQKEESIKQLKKAIEIDPNFKEQGEKYIKQIESGQRIR